jgi:hypothetical protein
MAGTVVVPTNVFESSIRTSSEKAYKPSLPVAIPAQPIQVSEPDKIEPRENSTKR